MEKLINELKEGGVEFVDLKLSDLSGRLHHITFPLARLQTALAQGVGFDGSSLGGFLDVAESDLVVKPDTSHLSTSDPLQACMATSMSLTARRPFPPVPGTYSERQRNL